MQMKERYRIMHTLQCVKGSPEVEDALERVETILSHLPEVLEHLAVSEFDFGTGLKIAEAAGLKHHYAAAFLGGYGGYLLVEELYDEDEDFASALNNLIGPDFEYPDWSHKTVGEVLEIFGGMNADQKKRAAELVSEWNTHYPEYVGDRMAALLQELIDAAIAAEKGGQS